MVNKNITVSLENLLRAWEELAPTTVFADMSLEQFRAATAPATEHHRKILWLDQERVAMMAARRQTYRDATEKYLLVVNSIKGSPAHGEDSPLYSSLGYTPKTERRSGLTRKKSQPEAPTA